MKLTLRGPLLALIVLPFVALDLAGCVSTQNRIINAASPYFDSRLLDLERVLPAPPANDSQVTRDEIELMLRIQSTRTPEQVARVQADAGYAVYRFADSIGHPEAFDPRKLPKVTTLFRKVTYEEGAVIQAGKRSFNRPRPFLHDPRIQPVVERPSNSSYPSGHAMWSRVVGLLLADMLPEYKDSILERADEYAYNRVVAGVHYPSDVEAGKYAGTALAAFLFASPEFQPDYAEAKKELREALKLPALP
jgi:acid phosphatase (class A)